MVQPQPGEAVPGTAAHIPSDYVLGDKIDGDINAERTTTCAADEMERGTD